MNERSPNGLTGRLTVLTEQKCCAIYDAALTVIAEVGMSVPHETARRLLLDAGATVEGEDLVRVPRELVARARDTVPPMIAVFDRDGELAMQLGGFNAYFGTGSDLMSTYDLETGERRPSVLADVRRMARLCDALPNIDFVMSSAYPGDVAPHASYLESFRAMAGNTTKPLVVTAAEAEDLDVMWRIACELRGGAEGLRDKPYFIHYGEPVSPLKHPVEVLDKLLLCADHGIPLVYAPAPTAGAAAPITPAGQIMQGIAESLFGLVIHQLRRPGAPFITGSASAKLDMSTLRQLYNSAERYSTDLGIIEMAKWMDIPNWSFAGTSDSQCVDAQAGIDAAQVTLLSMQAGANLNHDLGYLDAGLTCAPELVVIADEIVSMDRRVFEGVEVNEETLAVDVVAAAGPGGDFLRTKHTRRHVRDLQWRPTVFNRVSQARWEAEGSLDLREKARRRAREILATHEPAPLPANVRKAMDELVEAFVSAAG
jgi:trimethylamine---corrinoid protein Co-methyltransferase